jgi:hypothetical protein
VAVPRSENGPVRLAATFGHLAGEAGTRARIVVSLRRLPAGPFRPPQGQGGAMLRRKLTRRSRHDDNRSLVDDPQGLFQHVVELGQEQAQ